MNISWGIVKWHFVGLENDVNQNICLLLIFFSILVLYIFQGGTVEIMGKAWGDHLEKWGQKVINGRSYTLDKFENRQAMHYTMSRNAGSYENYENGEISQKSQEKCNAGPLTKLWILRNLLK